MIQFVTHHITLSVERPAEVDVESPKNADAFILSDYLINSGSDVSHQIP